MPDDTLRVGEIRKMADADDGFVGGRGEQDRSKKETRRDVKNGARGFEPPILFLVFHTDMIVQVGVSGSFYFRERRPGIFA